MAQNYIRFGYLDSKFAPTLNVGYEKPDKFTYYINHPPLLPILVSLSFRIFGVHEWSARLVPILFSIGNLFIVFILIRRLWGKEVALLASFFFTLIPMDAYFGRMVCHEAPTTMFFSLLCLYFYLLYIEKEKKWHLAGIVISFTLGTLTGWPVYYISLLITLHYLIFFYPKRKKIILPLILFSISITLFVIYIGYICFLGTIQNLIDAFMRRISFQDEGSSSFFTFYQFIKYENSIVIWRYFTPTLCVLSLIWIMNFSMRIKIISQKESFIILLLLFGLIHILLFPNGAWVHDYWSFYLTPFIILSATLGLKIIQEKIKKYIFIIPLFGIIFICFTSQSISQIKALHQYNNSTGYTLGIQLKQMSNKKDKIITSFFPFLPRVGPAFFLYLDRDVYP
ncbi:MAG: glycosyltransferase family 39 protein [bacterium]